MLGAVQGLAETIPVSSSAQLSLVPDLLGWPTALDRTTLAAALHAGSCAGVAWALRAELRRLGRGQVVGLLAASAPAALAGLALSRQVDDRLGDPRALASLLGGAGVLLWWADRRPTDRGVTARATAAAAAAQVLALAPGVSRLGATLTALRLARVRRDEAQRHSLLLSLPITAGAAALTLARTDRAGLRALAPSLCAGLPVAAVTSALTTRALLRRGAAPITAATIYRLAVSAALTRRTREHV